MKNALKIIILLGILGLNHGIIFAQNHPPQAHGQNKYQLNEHRKINSEIDRKYIQIRRIKNSKYICKNEKLIKIARLKREIAIKQKQAEKIKHEHKKIH